MWFLPISIVAVTVVLSVPIGFYLAWIIDGRYRAPAWLRWVEGRFDTGEQDTIAHDLVAAYGTTWEDALANAKHELEREAEEARAKMAAQKAQAKDND